MEHALDFLVRLGEVTIGILALIFWVILIAAIVIEIIDFLVVDPIRRKMEQPETTETQEV